MDLSVIIVNYNTKKLIKSCIESIIKNTEGISHEIIVVDNGSSDGSQRELNRLQKITKSISKVVDNKENLGFGSANNKAMKIAKGNFFLLLNTDTEICDNVLGEMTRWMKANPRVGISSCSLKSPNGRFQGTGGYFPTILRVFSWMTIQDLPLVDRIIKPFHPVHSMLFNKGEDFYLKEQELDWVTGAFFFMRRDIYDEIGGFDEDYFMYTEEVDLCFRAKKNGWKVCYLPRWSILHLGGASGKSWSHVIPEFEGIKLFYKKHYPKWQLPMIRIFLKLGALGRVLIFRIIQRREAAQTYARAFTQA